VCISVGVWVTTIAALLCQHDRRLKIMGLWNIDIPCRVLAADAVSLSGSGRFEGFLVPSYSRALFGQLDTRSLKQRLRWETNRCWRSEEVPNILRNPNVRSRVHKTPSSCPEPAILSCFFLRCIWVLSNLPVGLRSGLCPSGFPTKTLHAFLFSSVCVLCSAHFIGLDIVTGKMFGEAYNS
jgi:hypothetical protein